MTKKLPLDQNLVTRELVPRRFGLHLKVLASLATGAILFTVLVLLLLNYQIDSILRAQWSRRAFDIASNLGDAAATHVMRSNVLELDTLTTKYGLLNGVAYTVVRDGKGQIIAHSLGTLPSELRESLLSNSRGDASERTFEFRDREVYETRTPILDGRLGAVHVGIWVDSIEAEIQQAILPLFGFIAAAFAAGVGLLTAVTLGIVRRIRRLKEIAGKVSGGDLETRLRIEANDEIGDLANSLERMRSSLKAAMVRLDGRKKEKARWSLAG
jgi:two-component system cell cycle sensor histidine kinase/response regulator CckA